MKPINYYTYRGDNESHRLFWQTLPGLPPDQHIVVFLDFFKEVKLEIETGLCTLREAGYALSPAQYDDAIHRSPNSGGITVACGAAEDLASWIYGDVEEAWEDWRTIVDALDGLME